MPIRRIAWTAFAVLVLANPADAAQQTARITRVVLYPGSATVERSIQVVPGTGLVEMTGLPANFDVRTLRVEADPGIRVGEVAVQDVSRSEALGVREAELEARIQALKDAKAALDVEVKTAELVRDYLAGLTRRPSGEHDKGLALDGKAISAVLEAIRRGGADAYGLLQRVEIKKRGLDKEIAALERELGRLKSGARDARTLAISYAASSAGAVRAVYQVANAGWKPAYRASLDSAFSRVELERLAAITQRTGEDWRGVTLRLSTGQPRHAQNIEPPTWQLALRPPPQPVPAAEAARHAMREMASAKASMGDEARNDIAQVETLYATEFEVPGKVDLAADGRHVNVSLAKETIEAQQRVRVVPRREPAAMVTAEADLPEGVWIPGEMQLYRDGAYIGSTFWQARAKERLVLPFGRDDRVLVSTTRTKNRSGSAGFVGSRAERQVADLYTITSRHKVAVDLLVLEASPVAVNDQISVQSQFEPKPQKLDWEQRRGVVAWEQPLIPGETLKFAADYTIRYPKDVAVIGLP